MGKRIVLVDDDVESRRSVAALLRNEGHQVKLAANAMEAQVLCADCQPEIAIVDVELPGIRGDEWALFLKESCPETRIIFISGRPGLAGLDRYGPDVRFVHKPFDVAELLDAIDETVAGAV